MKILIYEPNGALAKFFNDYMFSIGIVPFILPRPQMIIPQSL